jgi:outer membrane murein-binding lipoprotein Lpp
MDNYYLKYKKYKTKYLNLQYGGDAFVGATSNTKNEFIKNKINELKRQSGSVNNKETLAAKITDLEGVVKKKREDIQASVDFIKNTLEEIAEMKKQLG